jgi:hypothetical protein
MLPFLMARTDNYAARKLSVIFYPQRKKVAPEELFQINSKLHDPRRDEPERDQIASSKDMDVSKFADLRRCVQTAPFRVHNNKVESPSAP